MNRYKVKRADRILSHKSSPVPIDPDPLFAASCPRCGCDKGYHCETTSGKKSLMTHEARIEAAQIAVDLLRGKPRIFKRRGSEHWVCDGAGVQGHAPNAADAFKMWCKANDELAGVRSLMKVYT